MGSKPTLAERVHAILTEEHGRGGRQPLLDGADREPRDDAQPSVRERDFRDWGLVYGLAFGMLAAEEPHTDREELRDRALDAARAAYGRWAGGFAPRRAVSPLVDAAIVGFEDTEDNLAELLYRHGQHKLGGLMQPLSELRDVLGVPAREAVTA